MKHFKQTIALPLTLPVFALAISMPLAAEEDKNKKLEGQFELGVIATSGNTETQSYKGKLDIKQDLEHWRNQFILEGLYKRDQVEIDDGSGNITEEDRTTAEKYFGSAQGDYKLNAEYASFFMYAEYESNRFSGFDHQYTVAAGYSNRLFTTDNSHLTYDIGPGYTVDQPEDIDGEAQDTQETVVIRVAIKYEYQISDNAKFSQAVSSNYSTDDEKNTKTKSVTALTAQLNSSLALRASYTVDYNSEVPSEREHADSETALTVVYSF
ncbi:MAG: DUF481 domain-containing protein [Agarilytica sp.]